jgi:protein TonB
MSAPRPCALRGALALAALSGALLAAPAAAQEGAPGLPTLTAASDAALDDHVRATAAPDAPADALPSPVAGNPAPAYPATARRAGVEGQVVVRARVTAEGTVHEVQLRRGAHPLLDEAALDAVERWRFTPALRDGRPVAVWANVPIRFYLAD